MKSIRFGLVFALAAVVAVPAFAAIQPFSDRNTWESLLNVGVTETEDFEGFVADTEFRTQVVPLSLGSITQTGINVGNFRNFVDVPPLALTDNGGSSHASCFVNGADGGAGTETAILLTLATPTDAWGANFYGVEGPDFGSPESRTPGADGPVGNAPVGTLFSEGLTIQIYGDGNTLLASFVRDETFNSFFGVVATQGEQIESIRFVNSQTVTGGLGEGFGMDDIVVGDLLPPIPALSPLGLTALALALAALSFVVLRRRRTASAR